MLKLLHTIILLPLIAAFALEGHAQGQPRHTVNVTESPQIQISIDVYEYNSVDVHPQFPGGDTAMLRFINHERRYPQKAYDDGIEGRVLCSFVVNEDGSVSHISVIKGVEESLNREAVRILSKMPAWDAGFIDDTPVPVYCILPISFRR
ncbi:MAG: energy transducer TonB [Staphylococcus sp.]|nr:energy transducer TonB [Staphylococcus sp.]